jgi:hypothetical protein
MVLTLMVAMKSAVVVQFSELHALFVLNVEGATRVVYLIKNSKFHLTHGDSFAIE